MTTAFGRDLASSYAASIARVGSWLIVSAIVYHHGGEEQLALLMLLRGTVGLLSYAGLGLSPALVREFTRPLPVSSAEPQALGKIVEYASPASERAPLQTDVVFTTSIALTLVMMLIGVGAAVIYAQNVGVIHGLSRKATEVAEPVATLIAVGVLFRTFGDVFGAKLQADRMIWLDNVCVVIGEVVFAGTAFFAYRDGQLHTAQGAAAAFFVASLLGLIARAVCNVRFGAVMPRTIDLRLVLPLLGSGSLVLASQIADWFYAPLNQVLIQASLSLETVAVYVPAMQVDAALLLLTAGLTNILLPHAAGAAVAADRLALRRYFLQGTAFSFTVLAFASFSIWLISGHLFQAWFHDPLPATQAILPFVLVHTTVGSIGGVGRAVLFGMGRIKPYAVAAIVGGVLNAVLAVAFLNFTDLGLHGVVLATVISVTLRCGVWMPWYTLRAINNVQSSGASGSSPVLGGG